MGFWATWANICMHISQIAFIISIGAIIGMTSVTFVNILEMPRIFKALSDDGMLCKFFSNDSSKSNALTNSTLITGGISMVISMFFKFTQLVSAISLSCCFGYAMVSIGILTTRYRDAPRPQLRVACIVVFTAVSIACGFIFNSMIGKKYSYIIGCIVILAVIGVIFSMHPQKMAIGKYVCPFVPVVPMISMFCNLFMFGTADGLSWLITGGFMVLGVLLYLHIV